ncbi:MAG: c-type cytochrome [Actinomycetota bacterium]|nr:c-type cytochrome [Actinomycetota bacterium]
MRRVAVLALALVLPLGAGACGSGEERDTAAESVQGSVPQEEAPAEGNAAAGKEIFASQGCGGCHTFQAAGTNGTVGPNLDDLKPSFEDAYKQIQNGGGGMPPFGGKLSKKQIADVATFVSNPGG